MENKTMKSTVLETKENQIFKYGKIEKTIGHMDYFVQEIFSLHEREAPKVNYHGVDASINFRPLRALQYKAPLPRKAMKPLKAVCFDEEKKSFYLKEGEVYTTAAGMVLGYWSTAISGGQTGIPFYHQGEWHVPLNTP